MLYFIDESLQGTCRAMIEERTERCVDLKICSMVLIKDLNTKWRIFTERCNQNNRRDGM